MSKRVLPHNVDAEASVLGGLILRSELLAQLDTLEPGAFYDHRHRVVFAAMRELEAKRRPVDVTTLGAEIEKQGQLDAIGGHAFLGQLALHVPIAENVLEYAALVDQKHRARSLMLAAGDIVERGYESELDVDEYFSMAMAMLGKLDRAKPDRALLVGDLVKRRVKEIDALVQAKARGEKPMIGVPTGIAELDRKLGGYPLGDVTLLAARPAMGKTSMAMACVDAASAAGHGAHVFSQEGGWRMYADRCISRGSGLPVERIRAGELEGKDFPAIGEALVKFHTRNNWLVDDRAGLTAQEIIRSVRRWKAKLGTKLVLVDYVQIIKRTKGLDENAALDEIITAFSHAALADDIAYVIVSQLNRKVEDRTDKRPQLSDLRGSGALEERPRVIVSPFRGAYYYDEPKQGVDFDCDCIKGAPCSCAPRADEFQRQVQLIILKNSNGATGRVWGTWKPETAEMS